MTALVRILSVLSVALYLVPTGAHLAEMRAKFALSQDAYMSAQRPYDDWALFGAVLFAAILLTALNAVLSRASRVGRWLSATACLFLMSDLALFFAFTYPVNLASQNWTIVPPDFDAARLQWEVSHAASAAIIFVTLIIIVVAALASARAEGQILPPSA